MKIEIFDVEHGQCTLITSDAGAHMLIDAGHNSTSGWRPSGMLKARGIGTIDRLVITNFDEDHVSDLQNVVSVASVTTLARNRTVTGDHLLELKGSVRPGAGMETLASMLNSYVHPVSRTPDFGALTIHSFCNSYPEDFEDENNLSLLQVLEWPNLSLAFTGDLEAAGWAKLLERESVRTALSKVNVFVASHHGRLNGYNPDIFDATGMKPAIVVISDSGIDYESQKTGPIYRARAAGIQHNNETRRVFTTRRDGTITIVFGSHGATLATSRTGRPLF